MRMIPKNRRRKNLENRRIALGYTQQAVADFIGVTARQYQRFEAGTSNGTIPLWHKMSRLLNESIDFLLQQEPGAQADG